MRDYLFKVLSLLSLCIFNNYLVCVCECLLKTKHVCSIYYLLQIAELPLLPHRISIIVLTESLFCSDQLLGFNFYLKVASFTFISFHVRWFVLFYDFHHRLLLHSSSPDSKNSSIHLFCIQFPSLTACTSSAGLTWWIP